MAYHGIHISIKLHLNALPVLTTAFSSEHSNLLPLRHIVSNTRDVHNDSFTSDRFSINCSQELYLRMI
jgi:hypothetical protein